VTETNQTGSGPGIEGQPAPKRAKTGGRTKGTPNKVAGQIRKDAGAFFRACTSENVKFRKKLLEFCESGEVLAVREVREAVFRQAVALRPLQQELVIDVGVAQTG